MCERELHEFSVLCPRNSVPHEQQTGSSGERREKEEEETRVRWGSGRRLLS